MHGSRLVNYILKNKIKESIAAHEFGVISDESFSSCYIELGKIYEKKRIIKSPSITTK